MAYNGSGVFIFTSTTVTPAAPNTLIESSEFNTFTADVKTGLDNVVCKDGQTTCTARIPFAAGISLFGTNVTSTAAELNLLDGVTSTTAELNILDGVTSTTAELNILDGVTATTAELNILDGVTSTTSELNILDGVTSTASELNILDGVTSTTAELNILDGVTSTAAELNILDGVTKTAAEINDLVEQTNPVLNGTISGTAFLDDDTFTADSAIAVASQQSIKAYIATQVATIVNYSGMIDISENNIVSGNATVDAWTMTSAATGKAIVTHNLGTTDYSVVLTGYTGGSEDSVVASLESKDANSFEVWLTDENGSLDDKDAEFILVLQT